MQRMTTVDSFMRKAFKTKFPKILESLNQLYDTLILNPKKLNRFCNNGYPLSLECN